MGISAAPLRAVLAASAVAVALVLTGCAPAADPALESPSGATAETGSGALAAIADLGLDAADPAALVEGLDALPVADRPEGLSVSVLPSEVRIQPEQPDELVVPLDGDRFYLSLAPYREQTHPCTFHVPTSCLGELQNADIQLRITNPATGEVLLDEARTTADNGFTGVWLPRDGEFLVEVASGGDAGSQLVRTGAEDPTCLTTLQLS
ncbi:CueP family metal-binding protein [Leucobacter sp. PH1c]|uniref:CueP family metal-binding protein n=1 Tax=Leucobacter sp. PH1c TaxID=1397278 RepID=UPI00046B0AD5|nr:CueP family metal-binding protein [Leucobacter sp. PH1c]